MKEVICGRDLYPYIIRRSQGADSLLRGMILSDVVGIGRRLRAGMGIVIGHSMDTDKEYRIRIPMRPILTQDRQVNAPLNTISCAYTVVNPRGYETYGVHKKDHTPDNARSSNRIEYVLYSWMFLEIPSRDPESNISTGYKTPSILLILLEFTCIPFEIAHTL